MKTSFPNYTTLLKKLANFSICIVTELFIIMA